MDRRKLALAVSLAASALAGAASAQVQSGDVQKDLMFQQVGPTTVIEAFGGANATFYSDVTINPGDFDGGTLTFAGPASPQAFNNFQSPTDIGYETSGMTKAALDAAYPSGITYTLTATDSTGVNSPSSVNVPYADIYPNQAPALTAPSYNALQGANPASGMTLDFNVFTPDPNASASGIAFFIDNPATNSVVFEASLPSTATSVTYGAGTLAAGTHYIYLIDTINSVFGTDTVNGVTYQFSSGLDTFGNFTTAGGTVPEPASWALMLAGFGILGAVMRGSGRRAGLARR